MWVQGTGMRAQAADHGFRVMGLGFRGLGFWVWGFGFRVLGLGFWVLGFWV